MKLASFDDIFYTYHCVWILNTSLALRKLSGTLRNACPHKCHPRSPWVLSGPENFYMKFSSRAVICFALFGAFLEAAVLQFCGGRGRWGEEKTSIFNKGPSAKQTCAWGSTEQVHRGQSTPQRPNACKTAWGGSGVQVNTLKNDSKLEHLWLCSWSNSSVLQGVQKLWTWIGILVFEILSIFTEMCFMPWRFKYFFNFTSQSKNFPSHLK
jgi:hypothetical protein